MNGPGLAKLFALLAPIGGILATSMVCWILPPDYEYFVFWVLGARVIFDGLSLFYGILSWLSAQSMSGFPGVGLVFYAWFVIAYRHTLTPEISHGPTGFLVDKVFDLLLLTGVHFLAQVPSMLAARRRKPLSRYSAADRPQ